MTTMTTRSAEAVRERLRQVIDPEVGINIVDLGLIYDVDVEHDRVAITLTMTSPACPLAEYLKDQIARTIQHDVPWADRVSIELVWDPPWSPERLLPSARRQLGWPGAAPSGEPSHR